MDIIFIYANRIRRLFLPIVRSGGFDMLLLKSGSWIASDSRMNNACVQMRYDSEKHTVFVVGRENEHVVRDPWLSVTTSDGIDMSDFFNGLHITRDASLPYESKLMLFAHQKGWIPMTPLTVILRDGSSVTMDSIYPVDNDVNYIR